MTTDIVGPFCLLPHEPRRENPVYEPVFASIVRSNLYPRTLGWLSDIDGHWRITGFISNLTDEETIGEGCFTRFTTSPQNNMVEIAEARRNLRPVFDWIDEHVQGAWNVQTADPRTFRENWDRLSPNVPDRFWDSDIFEFSFSDDLEAVSFFLCWRD